MAGPLQPVLHMSAADGQLLANGLPIRVKGVTWWGAERARALPGGLDKRSLDEVFGLLARYGFNAVKLPFLHQHVLFDEAVPPASFDARRNPHLLFDGRPLTYVAALRAIARRAAGHGILVWLVAHSLEGLWYSRAISETTVLDSWAGLSRQVGDGRPNTEPPGTKTPPQVEGPAFGIVPPSCAPCGISSASTSRTGRGLPRGAAARQSTGTGPPHASATT